MPHAVGGRFSVFTVAGLLPLALAGVPVAQVCAGARAFLEKNGFAGEMGDTERVRFDAGLLFEAYHSGLHLHEMMLFHPALLSLGNWYRQLFAESLGKESASGERVGFVPLVALGSTDLHSVGQMIFGGAPNRMTTLVSVPEVWRGAPRHEDDGLFALPDLVGKPVGALMRAIFEGVEATYRAHHLPVRVRSLGARAEEVGAFLAEHMVQVMLLGELLSVNTFNQPNVEEYKERTRELLKEGK
jgi:glucose-6-phosphate isomerase